MGRPVRDYRWPNSQTLDSPWPSPSAEKVLERTQRGALHSTLDCIWGFTQVPISEQMADIYSLIARRGVLRPKVLYFGPKQGPAQFQGLMDSTFGGLKDKGGEEFSAIFMDDVFVSTEAYTGDDDDAVVDRHIEHL